MSRHQNFYYRVTQNLDDLYDINPDIMKPIDFNGEYPFSQGAVFCIAISTCHGGISGNLQCVG